MSQTETSAEVKVKILLDEANLAFSETSERKDTSGDRKTDGSAWEEGRMEGEYDEADYQRILELQMDAAVVCDEHPELEDDEITRLYNQAYSDPEDRSKDSELAEAMSAVSAVHEMEDKW